MKIKNVFFIFCFSFVHFFCVGNNNPPIIESITATPDSIASGGSVLLICNASDEEDKKSLTYLWDCTLGSISSPNEKDSAVWIAPDETGYFSISCEVSDNSDGATIKTIYVKVL